MPFKADVSFLEKLTMGATATQSAIAFLRRKGFEPIELERYSTSNKIWATKVKRLRLADVLCVRTGLRVEVRGKSDLQIKMSDSPSNPDRRWDANLRDDDLVALVACDGGPTTQVRGEPVFFAIGDLRATVDTSKLGPPKSASEGAERDRTWPSIVPKCDGEVLEVGKEKLVAMMTTGRRQSYRLKARGLIPYVSAGTKFVARATILAGSPRRAVDVDAYRKRKWNPIDDLSRKSPTDRYVAAKALGASPQKDTRKIREALAGSLQAEKEPRTALEIAASLARLADERGFSYIAETIEREHEPDFRYLPMEAVLILSEMTSPRAAELLDGVARQRDLPNGELRQAAVWGLGKAGSRAYERVLKYVDDEDDDVALHAIAGLGGDAGQPIIDSLVGRLVGDSSERAKAAASDALRLIGTPSVLASLRQQTKETLAPWVLATLGRLPTALLADAHLSDDIRKAIEPVRLLAEGVNWLTSRAVATSFQFLLLQTLGTPSAPDVTTA